MYAKAPDRPLLVTDRLGERPSQRGAEATSPSAGIQSVRWSSHLPKDEDICCPLRRKKGQQQPQIQAQGRGSRRRLRLFCPMTVFTGTEEHSASD